MALMAAEKLYEGRALTAELFRAEDPEGVVFTLNTTYALNLAILGLVREGDHVIISDMEHNSVLRPVEYLKRYKGVEYSVFSTKGDIWESVRPLIRKNTRAVICAHASNITGKVIPVERLSPFLREREILLVVDGAQSAGTRRIDMEKMGIDVLCVPAHKGLLGPQGAGVAVFRKDLVLRSFITGGSGALSRETEMPAYLPDRLEAGTMATPAVAGLCEGIKYVLKRGEESIARSEGRLTERISEAFADDRRVCTYGEGGGGIWLFNVRGVPSQTVSRLLDERGICTRPGLHCAPLAHKTLGTPEDGAVRVSAGPLTRPWQADHFIRSLREILDREL